MRASQSRRNNSAQDATTPDAVMRGAGPTSAAAVADTADSQERLPKRVRTAAGPADRATTLIDLQPELLDRIVGNFAYGTADVSNLAGANNAMLRSLLRHRANTDKYIAVARRLGSRRSAHHRVAQIFIAILQRAAALPARHQFNLLRHFPEAMLGYMTVPQAYINQPIQFFCSLSTRLARPDNFFKLSQCVGGMFQAPAFRAYVASFHNAPILVAELDHIYRLHCNAQVRFMEDNHNLLARHVDSEGRGSLESARASALSAMAHGLFLLADGSARLDSWHAFYRTNLCGSAQERFPLLKSLADAISDIETPAHRNTAFHGVVKELPQLTPAQRATMIEALCVQITKLDSADAQMPAFEALLGTVVFSPDTEEFAGMKAVISMLQTAVVEQRWPMFEKLLNAINIEQRPAAEKATLLESLACRLGTLPSVSDQAGSSPHLRGFDAILNALNNLPSSLRGRPGMELFKQVYFMRGNTDAQEIRFGNLIDFIAGAAIQSRMPMIEALLSHVNYWQKDVISGLHSIMTLIAAQPVAEQPNLLSKLLFKLLHEQNSLIPYVSRYNLALAIGRVGVKLPAPQQVELIEHEILFALDFEDPLASQYLERLMNKAAGLPEPFCAHALDLICHRLHSTISFLRAAADKAEANDDWNRPEIFKLLGNLISASERLPPPQRLCLLEKLIDCHQDGPEKMKVVVGTLIATRLTGLPALQLVSLYNRLPRL